MSLSAATFREILSRFASGVAVVTVADGEAYHGITVSSFASLSLDPLLVLVCIDKRARTHELLPRAGAFGVTILAADDEARSDYFAGRGAKPEPASLETRPLLTGAPILVGGLGRLDCKLEGTHPAGDHTIFVGRVVAGEVGEEGEPLLYFRRRYRRLRPAAPS